MTETSAMPLGGRKNQDALLEQRIDPVRARLTLIAKRLILFAALLALWEAGVRYGWIDPYFTSQPSMIWQRLQEWAVGGQLVQHVPITIIEAVLGFIAGTIVGGITGFIFGWFEKVADLLEPFIIAFYSLPKVALAPLFILWFGIGIETKIILTATIVFFLVFFNTFTGVRDTSRELVDIVRLMGAGPGRLARGAAFGSDGDFRRPPRLSALRADRRRCRRNDGIQSRHRLFAYQLDRAV